MSMNNSNPKLKRAKVWRRVPREVWKKYFNENHRAYEYQQMLDERENYEAELAELAERYPKSALGYWFESRRKNNKQ